MDAPNPDLVGDLFWGIFKPQWIRLALTFDDLHAKLSRRGVTEEVHAADVRELARRGWAEESSGGGRSGDGTSLLRAVVVFERLRVGGVVKSRKSIAGWVFFALQRQQP